MRKLKNLFLYGGLEKARYRKIQKNIWESNRKSLIVYSSLTGIGMLALLLLSLFIPVLVSSRASYIACIIVAAAMLFLSLGPAKKYPIYSPVCVLIFTSLLLAFGIILGTVVEPNQASASFGILLFAVPLLFTDTPIFIDCQLIVSILIYLIAARLTQDDVMYAFNLSFVLPYGICSLILCAVVMRMKISSHMLAYENQILSEKDQLTGMLNRRSYEQKLNALREREGAPVLLCAFDINGLKQVNDTLGHLAGDELICGAADCIRSVFGRYGTCYRIGGDEFFAVIEGAAPEAAVLEQELDACGSAFRGVHVSGLSISVGTAASSGGDDITEAVRKADSEMYRHKEQYHRHHR